MDQLDVVIRTHDPARLDELNRAVFSAALQEYRPLALHVVCQRFTEPALAPDVAFHLHNRSAPTPVDARAALLNLGIQHGTGRYLAFLDYDDLIYSEGWRLLVAELEASGAAVAFGAVLNATVCRDGAVPYVESKHRVFQGNGLPQLLRNNFCPCTASSWTAPASPPRTCGWTKPWSRWRTTTSCSASSRTARPAST